MEVALKLVFDELKREFLKHLGYTTRYRTKIIRLDLGSTTILVFRGNWKKNKFGADEKSMLKNYSKIFYCIAELAILNGMILVDSKIDEHMTFYLADPNCFKQLVIYFIN